MMVATPVLTAFEHDILPVDDGRHCSISGPEAERLLALNDCRPGFCSPTRGGVRLAGYAGLVNLGERMLEILPKVGDSKSPSGARGTFLRLLRLGSGRGSVLSFGSAAHDLERQTLLAVFVSRFLDEVTTLVRGGLVRRYRVRNDDLRVVRGRLDIARQACVLAMRPDRVASRFAELGIDNAWNQVMGAALAVVRVWIDNLGDVRRWTELSAAFGEVARVHQAVALLDSLVPDRQVAHYTSAIEWAGLILRLLSPNVRAGRSAAPELLMDMAQLFEVAVGRMFRKHAGSTGMTMSMQESGRYLASVTSQENVGMFRLRPDLLVRDGARILAVGDTKWKRLYPEARGMLVPSAADTYQMHAYAAAYPCEDLCLVYPYHSALASAVPSSFEFPSRDGFQPRLHVAFVDVGEDGLPVRLASDGTWFLNSLSIDHATSV